jgi:hypothetical protein
MFKSTLAICVAAVLSILAIVWYKTASPEVKSKLRESIDDVALSIPRILGKVMATLALADMQKRLS